MGHQDNLLERIERSLQDLGLTLQVDRVIDGSPRGGVAQVTLTRRWMHSTYQMAFEPDMTFTKATRIARSPGDQPLLVAGNHISERSAVSLREAQISYVDVAGNAHIEFDDVLVDVRGRRREEAADRTEPTPRPSNLFSPRRSQVIMVLLAWPELADANVRKIARASGVSLGQAHDTLALLNDSGYATDHLRFHGRHELLEHWTAAYITGLGPQLRMASFHGTPHDLRKSDPEDPVFLSGESALPELIQPETATLYMESLDPRLTILNRWRTDRVPNIFIRRKFWSSPLGDDGPLVGFRPAPWPLVYADLVASGDPRQREVANGWKDRHAGPSSL